MVCIARQRAREQAVEAGGAPGSSSRSWAAVMTTSGVSPSERMPLASASPAPRSITMVDWVREAAAAQVGASDFGHAGEVAPPRVTADGVDEHDTDRLVWMRSRAQPDQQPAVGMSDQHVRRLDPERSSSVARSLISSPASCTPGRVAGAQAGPIIGASARRLTDARRHARPVCWRHRRSPLRAAPSDSRSPRTPHTAHARRHRPPHPTRPDPTRPDPTPRQCHRDFRSLARVMARRVAAAAACDESDREHDDEERATGHRA